MRHVVRATAILLTGLAAGATVQAADIVQGQRVYERHCASCHGADGRPLVPGSPDFSKGETLQLSDVDLVRATKVGKNLMPAYDRVISEEDILSVLSYIRTLWR